MRWIAYAGCGAFLPYLVLHTLGAAGVPGIEPGGFRPTWYMPPAVFLLVGLVRPWGMVFPRWTLWLAGRRVPRFLPLTPVWLIAPALALYGTVSGILASVSVAGVRRIRLGAGRRRRLLPGPDPAPDSWNDRGHLLVRNPKKVRNGQESARGSGR
ncbi:hypothetical protein [Herbidospora yilanensis]|uniref:hypothetical protein n=1 Tax=Herbidospora yilanensis TaxID=354426 RepID=UPI0012FA3866|nr:hypothetical protein [Herbidospora yilanensis]